MSRTLDLSSSIGGVLLAGGQPLVVVVDRHRHRPLGHRLADHVLVQELLELPGRGDGVEGRPAGVDAAALLLEDVLAQLRAVGADVDVVGALDHGADLPRALAAEAAGGDAAALEARAAPVGVPRRREPRRCCGCRRDAFLHRSSSSTSSGFAFLGAARGGPAGCRVGDALPSGGPHGAWASTGCRMPSGRAGPPRWGGEHRSPAPRRLQGAWVTGVREHRVRRAVLSEGACMVLGPSLEHHAPWLRAPRGRVASASERCRRSSRRRKRLKRARSNRRRKERPHGRGFGPSCLNESKGPPRVRPGLGPRLFGLLQAARGSISGPVPRPR